MNESIYKVMTPVGGFDAAFGEEDTPVVFSGSEIAVTFFKSYLDNNFVTDSTGTGISDKNLEPDSLYYFCQSEESGILVIPPLDHLLDYLSEENEAE